jgi:hypothetical protein
MLISAIVACALSAPIASAEDSPMPVKPEMDMGAHTHVKNPMSQMQESMKAMQAQMDRIHKTTDGKERQKLMQEHMQAMQNNMKAMRDMGGPMMMGDGDCGGMMMGGKKGGMADGDMMKRVEMTEERMDMMQMMMEQMMQRDQAMESMPDM